MKIKNLVIFVAISLMMGCKPNAGPIELNDGKKWKVNTEMMPPLNSSQQMVLSFDPLNLNSYKELALKLENNNKELIASCTMKGQSHDELHKWLHPYMGLINDLKKANSESEAKAIFNKMEQSFQTFNQNFE